MVKAKSKASKLHGKISLPKKNSVTGFQKKVIKKQHKIQSIVHDFVAAVSDFLPQITPSVVIEPENIEPLYDVKSEAPVLSHKSTTEQSITFFQAIRAHKHFSIMAISLLCSFLVSATFYWAAKSLMKIKFDDMFEKKLPRYQNLVYGIGQVHNIDVDRIVLQDDLNEDYFTQVDGQISLDIHRILDENKFIQPANNQKSTVQTLLNIPVVESGEESTMKSMVQYS